MDVDVDVNWWAVAGWGFAMLGWVWGLVGWWGRLEHAMRIGDLTRELRDLEAMRGADAVHLDALDRRAPWVLRSVSAGTQDIWLLERAELADMADREVADQRLAEMDANPKWVIRGAELDARIDGWLAEDDGDGV